MKIRNFFIFYSHILISVAIFVVLIFTCKEIVLPDSAPATIVSIIFTLFGFSITSLTIVVGFMKDSPLIKKIMGKGHFCSIVSAIVLLFIYACVGLSCVFVKNLDYLLIAISGGSLVLVGYLIYFIGVLGINYIRLKPNE